MTIFCKRYQISDLASDFILKNISLEKLRKEAQILVIDDDEFVYLDTLNSHGYNMHYKQDINDLKDLVAYDIVLCDIKGVAKFLQSKYEGAYLVQQIKKLYPNKIVVAYTAHEYSPDFQTYLSYADDIMPKGASIEDWTAKIDRIIKNMVDPKAQWEITRDALLKANVPTMEVAKIESSYVKAIKQGNFTSLENLKKDNRYDLRALASLLTSFIIKVIKGIVL